MARALSSTPSTRRAEGPTDDAASAASASSASSASSSSSVFIAAADEWATRAEAFFLRALLPRPAQPQLALAGLPSSFPGAEACAYEKEGVFGGLPSSLWDGMLHMAVPKSRITRSKKRIKNYRKRVVADKKNILACKVCGELKLMHHLCKGCLKAHKKAWPRARMEEEMENEAVEMMKRTAERAVAKESAASEK
jgi:ribosomal protein L32